MWLNKSSVEVFIWDSACCVQWIWIITGSPHLSQHVNDDDNLSVNTSNYFIPSARKHREGSQSASFPVSDTLFWGKSAFGGHQFLLTWPHTSSVKNNSRRKSFPAQRDEASFDFQHLHATVSKILFYQPISWCLCRAQLERVPLCRFPKLGFNYVTLGTK